MSEKVVPSLLKGFNEFLPGDQVLFNHLKHTIAASYERHGFSPVETPAIERAEILLAKGGGETEKQMYKWTHGASEQRDGYDIALRFDLTVPTARYVAQHFNELSFPFKRYAIGKVWRAEKPQKGRSREFYQCDVDILDTAETPSMLADGELVSLIWNTFKSMEIPSIHVRISNRKILTGLLSSFEMEPFEIIHIMRDVDRLDKIGRDAVKDLLMESSLSEEQVDQLLSLISLKGKEDILPTLEELCTHPVMKEGYKEISQLLAAITAYAVPEEKYDIDLSIARGLDYYTGTVYETHLAGQEHLGSICSGGRYDNLVNHYTKQKVTGVGVSIGLTRLFAQLQEAELLPKVAPSMAEVMIANLDEAYQQERLQLATELREAGINVDVYYAGKKLTQQLKYANNLAIPYVVLIGEDEAKAGKITVKNMESGDATLVTADELIEMML